MGEQEPGRRQETVAEAKSFDMMASVRLLAHDIHTAGAIHPETMQRIEDEELTYVAEAIDRPFYSKFHLQFDPELGYKNFHNGEWRSYIGMLWEGIKAEEQMVAADPRRGFLLDMAREDLRVGYELHKLEAGEVKVWSSPFRQVECDAFGPQFMKECGMQPERRMGFLYRAERHDDGSLTLESHSIDNSDPEIFAEVESILEYDTTADLDTLIRSYDGHMRMKHGQKFLAGRLFTGALEENAYEFLLEQDDLIDHFMNQLTHIAHDYAQVAQAPYEAIARVEATILRRKEELTYAFWAAVKERLDHTQPTAVYDLQQPTGSLVSPPVDRSMSAEATFAQAYHRAVSRNDQMIGCGGSISFGKSFDQMTPDEVRDAIFGLESPMSSSKKSESYSFNKQMYCVSCQAPPEDEEPKKMCGPCGLCRDCDAKYSTET